MKKFDIPEFYRSPIISRIKEHRKQQDRLKKDFSPTVLDFGPLEIIVPRHFGFCYGVENAIEIIYRTVHENPGKRIFLLSEMIHNPHVNEDLLENNVQFIQDTKGNQLIAWDEITADDIVVVPAFGTTVEIEHLLASKNISTKRYNTTCPFVEKVWKRSASLGTDGYTVVIHGKPTHEETRATFSHSKEKSASIVIKDMEEAKVLGKYISGELDVVDFEKDFGGRTSEGFDPRQDLKKIGVVNQTTMLASDTQAIADYLKGVISARYESNDHFADTRDTLCYATLDNQNAVSGMLETKADLAIVIGGYNSSNTSHLVELCEEKMPTYFISNADKISGKGITHFQLAEKKEQLTENFIPNKEKNRIMITSGASCPDSLVDQVIQKLISQFTNTHPLETVLEVVLD